MPTNKKERANKESLFLKGSNSARNSVGIVRYHKAVIKLKTAIGKTYYIQCTTWRDKKQGLF